MKQEDKDNSTMKYNQLFILEFNQHQVYKMAKHQSSSYN